jgi:hypothetical protein
MRRTVRAAAVLLTLAFAPLTHAATPAPPDLSQAPPLPEGRLLGVANGDASATFLVLDNAFKTAGIADVWVFEAFVPPIEIGPAKTVEQGLTHEQIDCAKRTQTRLQSIGYDDTGKAVVIVLRGPTVALEAGGAYDLISDMLCRGLEPPVDNVLLGHQAALTAARLILTPKPDSNTAAPHAAGAPAAGPPPAVIPPAAAPK